MTTLTNDFKPTLIRIAITKDFDKLFEKLIPPPRMVVSVGLILAGMVIPLLMAVQLLQLSFLLGFVGFCLVSTGGVLTLIFCGEI